MGLLISPHNIKINFIKVFKKKNHFFESTKILKKFQISLEDIKKNIDAFVRRDSNRTSMGNAYNSLKNHNTIKNIKILMLLICSPPRKNTYEDIQFREEL